MRLLQAKCKSLQGDPQIKFKLLKYALGRGFDYEKIAPMVDKVLSDG